MKLSLLLTNGDDAPLFLETLRKADAQGLEAVWLAEGGGLFPNPAVAASAAAVATRRIAIRAGGLSLPLHNPIRVAEEWALVDNLSRGRVGIAFPFYDSGVETVCRLWRGEAERVPDGEGRSIDVRILPQPIQGELPVWLADAPAAATLGANLFLPGPKGLEEAVVAYRAAGGLGSISMATSEIGLWDVDRLDALGVGEVAFRVDLADARDVLEMLHGR
ncbi:MAG TPA: LLM class flavin-dependent oxidoreductase [Thermoanaerobaculia bacterium]|nr:LLM class flavin-dependent oxidoreductase [Thermoanaerobaculia bacterium]